MIRLCRQGLQPRQPPTTYSSLTPLTRSLSLRARRRTYMTERGLENVPKGLHFFTLRNKSKHSFIPSTKNFFGDINVERILCHTEHTGLLLPIDSLTQLDQVLTTFRDGTMSISYGKNIYGTVVSLIVSHPNRDLKVTLGANLFGHPPLELKKLRFALCSDDMEQILSSPYYRSLFSSREMMRLEDVKRLQHHVRRTHGIFAPLSYYKYCVIQHLDMDMYLDKMDYALPSSFRDLENQIKDLAIQLVDTPDEFAHWRHDEIVYDDDFDE